MISSGSDRPFWMVSDKDDGGGDPLFESDDFGVPRIVVPPLSDDDEEADLLLLLLLLLLFLGIVVDVRNDRGVLNSTGVQGFITCNGQCRLELIERDIGLKYQ
jgi:hypothetical protein